MEELLKRINESVNKYYYDNNRQPKLIVLNTNDYINLKNWFQVYDENFYLYGMEALDSYKVVYQEYKLY